MRRRWTALRCQLFGHNDGGFSTQRNLDLSGRPRRDGLFTIDSRCMRCGTYTGITVPDHFTIYRKGSR